MSSPSESDHYEVLQVSPRADSDTIERVFRHLAKRFHPDNSETGDTERFNSLVSAYRTLSDPEQRAAYDARYDELRREHWQIFDQSTSTNTVEEDRRLRVALLTILYQARRRDVDRPGVGILDLERILDCPEDHMEFHLWYMKQSGWIERLDNGLYAITVAGVNRLDDAELPWSGEERRISSGSRSGESGKAAGSASRDPSAGATNSGRTAGAKGSKQAASGTPGV